MFFYDRIYGELKFPSIIREALYCPGLLRLRDVRMANVPFFSFPAFASTSRYEHSLGVCHLAGILADELNLSEKDKIELMLAGLYHDVATPPFAHAMEEELHKLYNFNHEETLRNLIIGKHDAIGGHRKQIFLGRILKIYEICQSKQGRKLSLNPIRIADLAAGAKNDRLGDLISSEDIDLDNIDNVVRAASAMGVKDFDTDIAEKIGKAFVFQKDCLCLDSGVKRHIIIWQNIRAVLYGMIFASLKDFSQQTMVKDAIQLLSKAKSEYRLKKDDWSLSEDQFINNRLLKYPPTASIIKSMRLGETYSCLSYFSIQGDLVFHKIDSLLDQIKSISEYFYSDFLSRTLSPQKEFKSPKILLNFYIDKRSRPIRKSFIFFNQKSNISENEQKKNILIGIFTPSHRKWDDKSNGKFLSEVKNLEEIEGVENLKIVKDKYPHVKGVKI